MKRLAPLAGLVALAVTGCSRTAAPSGAALLARKQQAEDSSCYTVRLTNRMLMTRRVSPPGAPLRFLSRPVVSTMEWTAAGPEMYRAVTSTEAGGVVMVEVRNGAEGWIYVPSQQALQQTAFPATQMDGARRMALMLRNYDAECVGTDQIAGQSAWVVEVRPRFKGRPMERLWLDQETGILLRQEEWSAFGRLLTSTSVTSVVQPPAPCNRAEMAARFAPPVPPSQPGLRVAAAREDEMMPEPRLSSEMGYPLGRINWLPDGFQPMGAFKFNGGDGMGDRVLWRATDGLATIIVVQSRVSQGRAMLMPMPENALGPVALVERDGFLFAAMGGIDRADLNRIVDRISLP